LTSGPERRNMQKYLMALDAGTTSSRCIIFDREGKIVSLSQKRFEQHFPRPGYVEHDAQEIWETQLFTAQDALEKAGITSREVAALGITNQRETVIVWDRYSGKPVCPAIVWQDRRTAEYCDELEKKGLTEWIREKTGLLLDPYFSATKLRWILDNVDGARKKAERGDIIFGTVETWLIWNLTGGKVHVTDFSNASRTLLFNIHTLRWDTELLELFDIPQEMLPDVKPNSYLYGYTESGLLGGEIPIAGAAGDQQSALFGQTCFNEGEAKVTFGTGAFLLMNTGNEAVTSENGLVTTIAWGLKGKVTYALEGSLYMAGSLISWLSESMGFMESSKDSEAMAESVPDTNGCYLVPALTGLGAPYWDPYARGTIVGLTRGVNKNHVVRAGLESVAYQACDVLKAMEADLGKELKELKVDGGASVNNFLIRFLADILDCTAVRPACVETTAMGAAFLAGLAVGYNESQDEIRKVWKTDRRFKPDMTENVRADLLKHWHRAVDRALNWAKEEEENV